MAATLITSAPSADATSSFTFYGSGYGHGVGMSQWGAYGLARMGWSHKRILTHFYRGTDVRRPSIPNKIRIGLTWDRDTIHLTARSGPVRLWVGAPRKGRLIGKIPMDARWTVNAGKNAFAVRNASGRLIGGRTWGGPRRGLSATYADRGSRVFVPEADSVWFDGFVYNRGFLEFDLYSCRDANGCLERLVLPLKLEQYLYGLGEVPASWPMQSLEAQAVAARSYAVYAIRHVGIRAWCRCHLTDGASDQVYMGYDREGGSQGARWVRAVDRSRHQVVTYKGKTIQAFFAASDGGHSEDVENVWHGGDPDYAIPWLRGVCDPGESSDMNPWTDWRKTYSSAELTSRLVPYTGSIGTITGFSNLARTAAGRILKVTARGTGGTERITGTELRAGLGLYDDRVWINTDRNIVGAIRERYDALMCAPGLPTSSRDVLSKGAQQFFRTGGIFRNDDAGRTVWLKGVVFDEYAAVGAGSGELGLPVGKPKALAGAAARAVSCSRCSRTDFARGRIYWKAGTGAHALWGRVLDTYLAKGGAPGNLGFPLTRVKRTSDGGRRARFQHGRVVCPKGETCRVTIA